jgi:hypothetical protein
MELPHEVRSPDISGVNHFADTDQIEAGHNAIWPAIHSNSPALTIRLTGSRIYRRSGEADR